MNMKFFFVMAWIFLSSFISNAQDSTGKRFVTHTTHFSCYVDSSGILIVHDSLSELLRIDLSEYDAGRYLEDTTYGYPYVIWDIDFDGYDDISFPSYSGNVQRFHNVYLYTPASNTFVENEELENIACLDIDEEHKLISGNCFHSSAAENWTEKYRWNKHKLMLVEKEGTMPCPESQNCYYTYRQKRIKGRMQYVYKQKNKI